MFYLKIKSEYYIYILCIFALSCIFLDLYFIIGLTKEGFSSGFPTTFGLHLGSPSTIEFHLYCSFWFYISLLLSSFIKLNNTSFLKTAIILFYYIFFKLRNDGDYYLVLQLLKGFILLQCIYFIFKYNIIKSIIYSMFPLYILSIFLFWYCPKKTYMFLPIIFCFKDDNKNNLKIELPCKNILLCIIYFILISIVSSIIAPYFISTKFHNNICYSQIFFLNISTFVSYIGLLLSLKLKDSKYINIIKYILLLLIIAHTECAFTTNNEQISKLNFVILFLLAGISFINVWQISDNTKYLGNVSRIGKNI